MEEVAIVIVGGGVMGASAAWALSRRQAAPGPVLLLEQFALGHTRGSSHGGSRIFRYTHPVADEAALMPDLLALWRALERESGEALLTLSGGLFIGERENDPFLLACTRVLTELGMPFDLWDATALAARAPQFRLFAGEVALFQPQSGIVAASPAVAAMTSVARSRGVEVRSGCRVTAIEPQGETFIVHYVGAGGRFSVRARRVVLAAGPWAPGFLRDLLPNWPPLPFTVSHQQVAYYRVREPAVWSSATCPVFIYTADPHVYGFPTFERSGQIKVARELLGLTVDPDADRAALDWATAELTATVGERLVGVEPQAIEVTPCLYTETPTRDFVIDRHPEFPGLVIAAGFSGRGFKFAPGVGTLLASLATSDDAPASSAFWLPRWALDRFAETKPATIDPAMDLFNRTIPRSQ